MSIYLDWNATTPLRQSAADAWLATQQEQLGKCQFDP